MSPGPAGAWRGAVPGPENAISPGSAQPDRWRILLLLSGAVLLGMSLWFSASASGAQLAVRWGLTPSQGGWLTTVVQLGFVAGTALAALLNLADTLPLRRYFAVSAVLAAVANALLLLAPGLEAALLLRFFTGFFLAGVYPPAMKMVSTWFVAERGLAIGAVVGALTVGKAAPFLLYAAGGASGAGVVILGASAAGVGGALLVLLTYRDGPYPFQRRPFSWGLAAEAIRHRETRLATGGYLGHMWELYPMWTLVGLFLRDHYLSRGHTPEMAALLGALSAFAGIAAGGPGALLAGALADRLGRERIAVVSMGVSGACALLVGWLVAAPTPLVLGLVLLWGFAVVADSAQFSAVVTERGVRHAVGTALTLQLSLGFLLSAVAIWVGVELQLRLGWGVSFSALALGPLAGISCMLLLARGGAPHGVAER